MNDRVDPFRLLHAEARAGSGIVVDAGPDGGDDVVGVERAGRVAPMRRAVSCLVVPQAGDRVCWQLDDDGDAETYWITQILMRAGTGPVTLRLPADATLVCDGGIFRISGGELHLDAETLEVRARKTLFLFETAETIGACWEGVVTAMRWTGSTLTSVVDRLTTIAKTRLQVTEGQDSVRAGSLDLRAQGLATVHAEHLLIEAERLVKTRAPQIHMG